MKIKIFFFTQIYYVQKNKEDFFNKYIFIYTRQRVVGLVYVWNIYMFSLISNGKSLISNELKISVIVTDDTCNISENVRNAPEEMLRRGEGAEPVL